MQAGTNVYETIGNRQVKLNDFQYPFDEVIKCNIGDAHAMGQAPITYIRQVVSGAAYPEMLASTGNNNGVIPADASNQAQRILDGCGGHSLGAYSNSAGIQVVREDIARLVTLRYLFYPTG